MNNRQDGLARFQERSNLIIDRIRKERKRMGLNQEGLGVELGLLYDEVPVAQATISRWENGSLPTVEQLFDLSRVFQCDVAYLLGEVDDRRIGNTDAAKYTGLTPDATEVLRNQKYKPGPHSMTLYLLSEMIVTMDIPEITRLLEIAFNTGSDYVKSMQYTFASPYYSDKSYSTVGGHVVLSPKEGRDYMLNRVEEEINRVCKDCTERLIANLYMLELESIIENRPGATNTGTANDQD